LQQSLLSNRLSRESLDLDIGQPELLSVRHHHTQATCVVREVDGIPFPLMLGNFCSDGLSDRASELLGPFMSSVLKILGLGHHPFLRGIHPDFTKVAPGHGGSL
jgi:hypothetical protein